MEMNGLKLLFVDDEEELVSAVVERLEIGHVGVRVTSGDEALQLLQRTLTVLLDIGCPHQRARRV
jgi:CheY-like chemotaxis protein